MRTPARSLPALFATALAGLLGASGLLLPLQVTAQDHPATSGAAHDAHTLAGMDTDHDGRISRIEFAAAHDGKSDRFAGIDSNGDGFISQAELDAHHAAMKSSEAGHDGHH